MEIAMGIFFIVLSLTVVAGMTYETIRKIKRCKVKIKAEVIRIEDGTLVENGIRYQSPVCSFMYDGNIYESKVDYNVKPGRLKEGDTIYIKINPMDPNESIRLSLESASMLLICFIIGFVFVCVGAFIVTTEIARVNVVEMEESSNNTAKESETSAPGSDMSTDVTDASSVYINKCNRMEIEEEKVSFYLPIDFDVAQKGERIYDFASYKTESTCKIQISDSKGSVSKNMTRLFEEIIENKTLVSEISEYKYNNNTIKSFKARNEDGKYVDIAYGANDNKCVCVIYYCPEGNENIMNDLLSSVKF